MKADNKKTILVVEDEIILAMKAKMSLEKYGYSVITVTTGNKAIEAVKSTPEIDLILMDIDLGDGIDGTQAAEIILKDRDIPVVFYSSHIEPEIVGKTEKITSYGYVVKGSSMTVLDASIKMAFKLFEAKIITIEKEQSLQTHQIELQMQNEELQNKQVELENIRQQYFDLYDMAPVSYFSLSKTGLIIKTNLTAANTLGVSKNELINKRFNSFIRREDQNSYYLYHNKLFETGSMQYCELYMRRKDDTYFTAYLKAVKVLDDDGNSICRVVVVELEQKNTMVKPNEGNA